MRNKIKDILERELSHAVFEGHFYEEPYGGGVLAHKTKHIERIIKEVIACIEVTEIKEDVQKREREKTLHWVSNYWKGLKQHGYTEKDLIIKFNKFIQNIDMSDTDIKQTNKIIENMPEELRKQAEPINKSKSMSIHDLKMLKLYLEMFLSSEGDLPDKRIEKSLQLVSGTIADSQ